VAQRKGAASRRDVGECDREWEQKEARKFLQSTQKIDPEGKKPGWEKKETSSNKPSTKKKRGQTFELGGGN